MARSGRDGLRGGLGELGSPPNPSSSPPTPLYGVGGGGLGREPGAWTPGLLPRKAQPKRLGLFGGTFNPIHYGHLRSAEEVVEGLGLDVLWFIPAALPPHKTPADLTPFEVRFAMAKLAVGRHPRLKVSDIEGRRAGKSYSIETLRQLRKEFGQETELFFVLGLDAILEIQTWKDFRALFTLCHFVVLDRPGFDREQVGAVLRREVDPGFREMPGGGYEHPSGNRVLHWQTTLLDISATRIRTLVREGRSARFLLPEGVRRFIIKYNLYRRGEFT